MLESARLDLISKEPETETVTRLYHKARNMSLTTGSCGRQVLHLLKQSLWRWTSEFDCGWYSGAIIQLVRRMLPYQEAEMIMCVSRDYQYDVTQEYQCTQDFL